MDNTQVNVDEELYRRVPIHEDGIDRRRRRYRYNYDLKKLEVTSAAFFDTDQEISVDRACKKNYNASESQMEGNEGIVSVVTGDVKDSKIEHYNMDVEYDKQDGNDAHSKIVMKPKTNEEITDSQKYKSFKALRRILANLANSRDWNIKPSILHDDVAYLKF